MSLVLTLILFLSFLLLFDVLKTAPGGLEGTWS